MALTREQILAPRKPVTQTVPAPELGEGAQLLVRRLSAREFMALTEQAKAKPDLAYAFWIVATVIDDVGRPVFTEQDVAALAEQDATLIQRLTEAAMGLNTNLKEKAAGNSQTPPDGSSTASR